MADQDIFFTPALVLAALIRERKISPTEVVNLFLQRVEKYNSGLNAFCTVAADQALAAARETEKVLMQGGDLPPLLGVPIAVKDLTPTQGIRTTYGSRIFANHVPNEDGVGIRRLKQAGAIVLGKTNTAEFGYTGITDNPLFGRTNNPWNSGRSAGGSSGGSAAAVAAGLAPLAEGTDGGGSIRIPASFCGVYGFKPTFGRIPLDQMPTRFGTSPFWHEGFISRNVEDAALALSLAQGPDSRDPYSVPVSKGSYFPLERVEPSTIRVAYSPDLDYFNIDPEVRSAVEKALAVLQGLGCRIEEVSLGLDYDTVTRPFVTMWSVSIAAYYGEYLSQYQEQMSKGLVATIRLGQRPSAVEYMLTEKARSKVYDKLENLFNRFELLLTPTTAVAAFPHGPGPKEINGQAADPHSGWMLTSLFNLTGHPAASINCGFSQEGMPIGLQIAGPRFREELVLQLSKLYQEAVPARWPTLA